MRRPVVASLRRALLSLLVLGAFASVFAIGPAQASFSDGDRAQTRQACAGDQDCDGTPDSSDPCPAAPGDPAYSGCTDFDFDGVHSGNDACPDQPGPGTANGCPPPDADRDRIPDSQDKCPTMSGPPELDGCPPGYVDPDDTDGDGVVNADDQCPKSGRGEKVKANGCGPFRATAGLDAQDLKEMGDFPSISGTCSNSPAAKCEFRVRLVLSKSSARALKLSRDIADVTIVSKRRIGSIITGGTDDAISKREARAFRRAYENNTNVTMTMSGSYEVGTQGPKRLGTSTFTMKRKPQGGAYRVTPTIFNGDAGPGGTGLTRESSEDDF